ncbi:hypothetical protein GOP47_0007665 [Adiantum capillus-veneris]|uniref:Tetratricopeptide repeat protein 37 n=1 Tax=Adiantum capillus-veneris TaxID=13818 RepID=A0A9D4V1S0_ADICA|nr:hypothetical protein GOP47_0007665 [Adiantum capillus-veneris]
MAQPPKKNALVRAALEALAQGNHAEAVRCCKHTLKQDRLNYEAHVVLGKSLYASKKFEQAETSYRHASEINPGDARAWQGLAELHESTSNYAKVLEACKAVICVFQDKGDLIHLAEYTRRLANAHAALEDHQSALNAWKTILEMKSVSKGLYNEALSGVLASKAVLMESWIQENAKLYLSHDKMLDANSARNMAENKFASSQDGLNMEKSLRDSLKENPSNEKFETMLLQLLVWRFRESSINKGHAWRQSCLQVLQLCLSALSWHASSLAMVLLLALCEEDNVNDLFSAMGMVELAQGQITRLHFLGIRLAHAYPDHALLMPVLAFLLDKSCSTSLVQKRSLCENGLRINQNSILGWQVLAKLRVSEGAYSIATECIRRGLQVVNGFRSLYGLSLQCAELQLQLILGDSYVKSGNYDEASKVYQNIIEVVEQKGDLEAVTELAKAKEGQIKILLTQGRVQEASSGLASLLSLESNNPWALAEQGWLAYLKKDFEQATTLLERAVNLERSNPSYHYKLGLGYWKSDSEKDKALSHLLESARLDSSQYEVFRTLGHYHKDIPGGLKRAIRCYQKAVSINCEDSEAGEALCDLMDSDGQEMLELASCREASEKSPRAFWAFRRLGYIQARRKDWPEAARNLQHAVRGYPACPDVWGALGLAYQQLGMLTAALKAYGRVLTINGECSLYALQQSGNVLLMLGMYRKAVLMFQDAVEKVPEHPAGLFGLASALLGQAHECISKGALRWSASLLQEASMVASRGLTTCENIGSFWKLLGDIELSYARCLPWELSSCNLEGHGRSSRDSQDQKDFFNAFGSSVKAWKKQRLEATLRSKRAYQHALHLQPERGNLYADLCSCLDAIGHYMEDRKNSSSLEAELLACGGLALESSNADLWVCLGIVAQSKAIQQHAFIQALRLDGNHAHAWAKLGQLYLKSGEQELAEEAFTRARSADPTLGLTWAAMSKMHSLNRDGDLQDSFANILYAAQLSPIANFQLGLAKIAAATHQLDSAQVYAAIGQAVLQAPHLPEVHNYKGLVCELQGKFRCAVTAFSMSRAAVDVGPANLKPSVFEVKKQAASTNLARVLCKAGDPHRAVEEYEMLARLGNLEDSGSLRGYATALWQSGQQKLAVSIAKVAVKKSTGKSEVSAGIQLLAKFSYYLSGPAAALQDIHVAASHLPPESKLAITTTALSALAGKHDYLLQQMPMWIIHFEHAKAAELASLLGASMQLQQDAASALLFFQKLAHAHPQSLSIRTKLMQLLLERNNGLEVDLAARCCSLFDITRLEKAGDLQELCQMLSAAAVACSVCGNIRSQFSFSPCKPYGHSLNDAIQVLQRWMHLEPWNIMSQYHVVLSLVQQAREQRFPVNILKALQRLIKTVLAKLSLVDESARVEIHNYIHLQLLLCKSEVDLHAENLESAIQSAIHATKLDLPQNLLALAPLQLIRCYTVAGHSVLADAELQRVGDIRVVDFLARLSAVDLTFQVKKEKDLAVALKDLDSLAVHGGQSLNSSRALIEWKKAEICIHNGDLLLAEAAALNAATLWSEAECLHLLHGAICMELVKHGSGSKNLSTACRRLMKVAAGNGNKLPIARLLLVQAQAGKAGTPGLERLLHDEWGIWPAEHKPAELYFQMGILGKASKPTEAPDSAQSPRIWFRRAVHINPSCPRYWTMLLHEKRYEL